jgi:PAS domain S-box-containing protein
MVQLHMKKFISSVIVVFILFQFVFAPSSLALDPQKAISQYTHTNWQTDDGLPQIGVQCILQTRDGYLWIGTQEGLARFDGVQFTVFDNTNTKGIRNNSFTALIQSSDGSIWAGTQGGLIHIVNNEFRSYSKAEGLANDNVYGLYEDAQKNLWIGTGGGGVNVWKDGKFKNYSTKDGLAHNFVVSIVGGKDGAIYIGTSGGVSKYFQETFKTYSTSDGLIDNNVLSVCIDNENVLWVGTFNGVSYLKNGKWTTFSAKDGIIGSRIRALLKDRDGNLWFGSEGSGIIRFYNNRFSHYSTKDGLNDGNVWAYYEDREKNLWVGTIGGGLHCFRDGKITTFGEKEGLSQENTRAIYEGHDESIWAGSESHGITRFKNGSLTTYFSPPAIANFGARGICEGHDGSLWFGTYGGGLCRFKNGIWTTYTTKDGLPNNRVYSLTMAKDGTLWVGTRGGGLSTFKNEKFFTYSTTNGLSNNDVRNILEASDGSIWICTSDGLNRFNDGKLKEYNIKDGLSYNNVYTIFEDENRVLWIGTYGGGLNRFKDGVFTAFTTKQGLYDNTVFQIIEDEYKYFWLTCNRGIYRVSEKDLNDYADGKIQTIPCTALGTVDGMRSVKCNGSCQPAGIRAHDGKIWIPTVKGIAIVDPKKFTESKNPPPVFIEHVFFDNRAVPMDSVIQLEPGQGDLELHYTALSYAAPKLMRFKYMLIGFDNDWIDAHTRRTAYYTNLPPGKYTFKVIASNNEGVWNWTGQVLRINLTAHYYQTIWFRSVIAGIIILLGFGMYRLRIMNLRRRERELVHMVDDRTKNLQQEVGERRRTEEELQILSSHYEAVLGAIPDIIMEVDIDKVYRWANHAGTKFFGEDVIGKPADVFFVDEQQTYQTIQSLFNGNEDVVYVESWQRRRDGEKRLLAWWCRALKDAEGKTTGVLSTARDITERKQAEESLALFSHAIRSINECISITDTNNIILFVNQAFVTTYGYSKEELIGKSIFMVRTSEKISKDSILKKTFGGGWHGELLNRKKDGTVFPVSLSTSVVYDEQGKPIALVGIAVDITERNEAEATLQETVKNYRLLFEQNLAGVYHTTFDGVILDCNEAFITMLGYNSLEELRVHQVADLYFDKTLRGDFVSHLKIHGFINNSEITLRRKDGTTMFGLENATLMTGDKDSLPATILGTIVDISIRKKAEEALAEERTLLRTMIDNIPDRIYAKDAEGRFTSCNLALMIRMGANNLEEIIGKSDFDFLPHELATRFRSDEQAIIKSGQPLLNREEPMDSVTGETRWSLATKVPLRDNQGNIIGIVGMGRDITEQKRLRQELAQSQKMQSIGTLASGIAHDFNNILGIILGYSSILEKRKVDDARNLESLAAINQAVQRGAALVRQILTFARKTEIVFELINPREVVNELLTMLQQTFPKIITFSVIVAEDIPNIHADRTQIHQVLLNLCVNARDAMPNGGSIVIKMDLQTKEQVQKRFSAADQDFYVCIGVTDTGDGMDDATRLRVFDPFYTTKAKGKGTGLGLSVVYGVVKAHQGFIDLESKVGFGTTFQLFFPVQTTGPQAVESEQSAESFDIGGTETILFVEDEELLLDMVHLMLEFKGYTVFPAKSGTEAIEIYKQHKQEIAVVLTDLGLPGMTGMDEFMKLKEITPAIKIIFASGFFEPDMKSELLKKGAKGFIQKPYTTDEVLRTLRKVLDE